MHNLRVDIRTGVFSMRPSVAGRPIFDLTQPLGPRTPRSSDHPEVRFDSLRWRSRHGLRTSTVTTSLHVGTHIDAPNLYFSDGATIDKIDLGRLCASAGGSTDMKHQDRVGLHAKYREEL